MPARAKINGSYVNAALMKHEAIANGYDDAIAEPNRVYPADVRERSGDQAQSVGERVGDDRRTHTRLVITVDAEGYRG